jgi:ubiquinone/menaquinone biosynthesis C-methylase UbiE
MENKKNTTKGWGIVDGAGTEIWDDTPVFLGTEITKKERAKLLFYPKKWMLYRHIERACKKKKSQKHFRILDVGCGTGAAVIDLKKMLGKKAEVKGIDVVHMQVEIAEKKVAQHGVWAEFAWYEGVSIPYQKEYFDAIYTSDVLGHVEDVPAWLDELQRVLKPGGVLAMFSESQLGKHAYVRNYLQKRGLNVDPHAEFHISLYPKAELRHMIERAGFEIKTMRTAFWASFLVHPDEFYEKLQGQKKFFVLKIINKILYVLKKKTHPFSTAAAELYGLVEMYVLGRWVEAQGYIVLARKREKK